MQKDNTDKMASMKISKLMITMGIPMIFSMNLGVKGAAYATVIGQIISLIMAVIFHYKKDKAINKSIKCSSSYCLRHSDSGMQ